MFSKKVKKIKNSKDFDMTINQLEAELKKYVDSGMSNQRQIEKFADFCLLITESIGVEEYEKILCMAGYDDIYINDKLFRNGVISHYDYEKKNIALQTSKAINKIINEKADPYLNGLENIKDNISLNSRKKMNEVNLRFGNIDFIDYEIENANIREEPYVKVFFTPSEDKTEELEIDIRYNDIFIDKLKEREGFRHLHDDDGNLVVEDLVEQWFHTAVIVLAANMLKETDLDFFRSISSDDPGSELIQKLEFDRESVPEEYRDQFDEFMKYKGIYR